MAQWLRRLPTEQEIPGWSPGVFKTFGTHTGYKPHFQPQNGLRSTRGLTHIMRLSKLKQVSQLQILSNAHW